MDITLSPDDEEFAKRIAIARNNSQREANRKDGKVLNDSLGIDIQGASAELAVAKCFDLEWDGKFFNIGKWLSWRVHGHDVAGLEVRSTHYVNGSLILHPKDNNYSPFVLVLTNRRPTYKIVGWAFGFEGKKPEYWRDVGYGRPCYYYPQHKLRPMDNLQDLIHITKERNKMKNQIINDVVAELESAEAKFPPFNSPHEGWAVLFEEVDELWEAVRMRQSDTQRIPQMKKEAVQVAAMAIRFLMMLETQNGER